MDSDEPADFSTEIATEPINSEFLSKRDEIALRKEKQLRTAKESMTFQPTLHARPRDIKLKGNPTVSRFDRLYGDAIKRLEEDPKSRSRPDDNELTFKPAISAKARSSSSDRRASDLVNSMHKGVGTGRIPIKESPKDPNLFKPTISKRANSIERSSSALDTSSRLYASKDTYKRKLDLKKAEDDKRTAELCTFSPMMSPKIRANTLTISTSPKTPPLIDRLNSYAMSRKGKLEQERASQELREMEGVTFQPKLVTKSKAAATSQHVGVPTQRGRDTAVKVIAGNRFDHLYKDAVKRKSEDGSTRVKVDESHMTFKPSISAKARAMSTDRKSTDLVHDINNSSVSRRAAAHEVPVDDFSYKPVISSRASSLDRSGSAITDRLYTNGDTEKMSKLKFEAAERELGVCTFSPDISQSNKVGSPLDTSMSSEKSLNTVERLLKYGEEKKRKLYEDKRARAHITMSDVTFQPKLPKSPPPRLEVDENSVTENNGNQFDRLYNDAMKRKSSESSIRLGLDDSLLISPKANSNNKLTFEDIGKRSKDSAEKRMKEELRKREVEIDVVRTPIVAKRPTSLGRSSSGSTGERQKATAEKKEEEILGKKVRESVLSPNLTVHQLRVMRSRSPSVESNGRSVSTFSQGSGSQNSAKIAGRIARDPAGSVVKRRMEEERRLKAERELAAVKLNFAKAEKELQVARSRSNSKGTSPTKTSPQVTPPASARRESILSTKSAEPSKGLMASPFISRSTPSKPSPIKRASIDVRPTSRAGLPFGRNV